MWKLFLRRLRKPAAARYCKLNVERLEAREVPAVITVTSPLDNSTAGDGQVTLREAIRAANEDSILGNAIDFNGRVSGSFGADTIVFAASLGNGVITTTQNDAYTAFGPTAFVIGSGANQAANRDLVIDGITGPNSAVTIDGNAVRRLFGVEGGVSLTLNHLTLQNAVALGGNGGNGGAGAGGGGGGAGLGGAVFNNGSLTVLNSTFVANRAQGGNGGQGAIDPEGDGGGGGGGGAPGFAGGNGATQGGGGGGGGVAGAGANGTGNGGGLGGADEDGNRASEGDSGTAGGGGGGGSYDDGTGNGGNGTSVSDAGLGGGGGGGGSLGSNEGFIDSGGDGGFGAGGGGAGVDQEIEGAPAGFAGFGGFGGGGGGGAGSSSETSDGGSGGFGAGSGGSGAGGFDGPTPNGGGGGGGAGMGGAIFNNGGTVTITNSTFNNNTAQGGAAGEPGATRGQGLGGAVFTLNGEVSFTNATLSGNNADEGRQVYVAAGFFGEFREFGAAQSAPGTAVVRILNSILGQTNNAVTDYFQTTFNAGTVNSSGTNNLIRRNGTGSNGFGGAFRTLDALLNALANNGGPTRTMALRQGSPAIDSATNAVSTDQRGVTRPQGTANDIGAFELQAIPPAPPAVPTSLVIFPSATKVCVGDLFSLTVQARTSTGINTAVNEPVIARILVGPPGSVLTQNRYSTLGVRGNFVNGVARFDGLGLTLPGTYVLQTFTPSGLSMTVTITVTPVIGRRRGLR